MCSVCFRPIWMSKQKFSLQAAIGEPYGTSFEVKDGKLIKAEKASVDWEVGKDILTGM